MSSPLLQLGLGALLENPAIVEFAARAGEKVLSILRAYFTFSAHDITNAYQESFGKALDELAQKRAFDILPTPQRFHNPIHQLNCQ